MADIAPVRICRAESEQASEVARLIDRAYRGYREQGISIPDVSVGVSDEIAKGRVWLAMRSQSLAGVLILQLGTSQAHLVNVAVSPDVQRQGIGRDLIRKAIDMSCDAGCREIILATHQNLTSNVALYSELGWRVIAVQDTRVTMSRPLCLPE